MTVAILTRAAHHIFIYNDHGDDVKKSDIHWRACTHMMSRWLTKLFGHGTTSNAALRPTIAITIVFKL